MKALVYHGPGKKSWEEKERPKIIDATDVIVRITKTTICGTDLHIMKGDVTEVKNGRTLGHEGIGVIDEAGGAVKRFKKGDQVLISCITSCGTCEQCKRGMYSHCEYGGWLLGHLIDGTQAEYVRIPFADTSLYHAPGGVNEDALVMLSDIFPTGFECGVLNGRVKPGDTVAIAGAGPIGLAALLTARFYSPSELIMIDVDDERLRKARGLGATQTINMTGVDAVKRVMELTDNRGVDVAIEAVGVPVTFEICEDIIAAGGHIANIGVFGEKVDLHMEKLWSQNITITTRLVDTVTTPMLLKSVESGNLHPEELVTHHFPLGEILKAYDTFSHAKEEKAIKVVLENR
ncbi:MAG: zinc-dependent alcohol dehydrogenase family protein [Deltaproteobacteria bacterium]|nr:zinc-dependent alcohol dehydrogenase family protein [Deltaproteobacteria bacterium]